jgi:hypothetical protein
VSTPAVIIFLLVTVVFVATVLMVFVIGRSVYRRSRVLAQELTSLAAELERTMNAVGQPDPPDHRPGI